MIDFIGVNFGIQQQIQHLTMFFKENFQRKNEYNSQKQPKIVSKDIGKFIFSFDEQADPSSDQINDGGYSSMSKLERLKKITVQQCKKIKPSIMVQKKQQNNYMIQSIQPSNRRVRLRQAKTLKNFQIVDNEGEDRKKQSIDQQVQQQQSQCSSNTILNPEYKSKNCISLIKCQQQNQTAKTNHLRTKKIQMVEQECQSSHVSINTQPRSIGARSQSLRGRLPMKSEFLFDIQSDDDDNDHDNRNQTQTNKNQISSDLTTHNQQRLVNLLSPDSSTVQLSWQLAKKIGAFEDYHNIRIFLSTPIPKQVFFEFQVHKYKNFMKTQYLLWLNYGDSMALFASATNNTLFIEKNIFKFQIKTLNSSKQQVQNKEKFIGLFVSDFKRQVYTLYDHQNYEKPNQNNKVICTVASVQNFVNPKLKSQQLYIPKVINQKSSNIYNNSISKNLKKLYKLQQFRTQISKFTTHPISKKVLQKIKQQSKVAVNTTRNAIIKDEALQAKLLLVKVQHNRFKIKATQGLTPIQLLCYAVVHLE